MMVKEIRRPRFKKVKGIETIQELQEREEFAEEPDDEDSDEEFEEDLLCVDNKAATQILVQESGSWRTRHLRVRSSGLKQRVEAKKVRIAHVPGRSMLADLNTKSHPSARLVLLRTLWGIEGPDEEIKKVQKVVVKALRVTQGSTARGSNDPLPPERPANEELSSSTSSQSTEDRLNSTLAKLNSREQAVREEYDEFARGRYAAGEENRGIGVEDHHNFMFELWKIANERADAFEMAYAEERSLRETVEERAERLIDFLREAGIFHPRGHEENERNVRIAREEEERRKSLHEEEVRRMMTSGTQKKPPKGPPPIAPASPKAEPKQGRVKEPPQSIGTPPVKGEVARLKALAESIAKEPPGASGIPTTRLAKVEKGNDTPWKIPPAEPKAMISEQ